MFQGQLQAAGQAQPCDAFALHLLLQRHALMGKDTVLAR